MSLDVLDIGCGTGFLSLLLAAERHRVTAVDVAPTMLARARDKAEAQGLVIRFIEADIETLDLPAASQDLIVERHVIWFTIASLPAPLVGIYVRLDRRSAPGRLIDLRHGDRDARV